ncbi:MAG: GNAT family N-acetyltransferase [Coriobacteriia bacterium]|nr:GNAT family N-acetyltransferase [Coriobacteriia bacterium]
MIRPCSPDESDTVLGVINAAAEAYRGVIPRDRWHEPYMTAEHLGGEIASGVRFFGLEESGELLGVMGIQDVERSGAPGVTLIRHAYVRPDAQRRGVGGRLLAHLRALAERPILVGTWADACWAVAFYERNGFRRVTREETARLLRTYWDIPERQAETSVVLAEEGAG